MSQAHLNLREDPGLPDNYRDLSNPKDLTSYSKKLLGGVYVYFGLVILAVRRYKKVS